MRHYLLGFFIWTITSVAVLVAFVSLGYDLKEMIFYPRSMLDILDVAFFWIATPCCFAAGFAFFASARTKPSGMTLLLSLGSAFVILGCLFAVWTIALNAENSAFGRNVPGAIFGIAAVLLLLPSLSVLLLPLGVESDGYRFHFGPWWRALLVVGALQVVFMLGSAIYGVPLSRLFADFAESNGGHYYTWLNAFDPWCICMIAIAGATQVGLSWARAHDAKSDTGL